jgi:hypothetical protein
VNVEFADGHAEHWEWRFSKRHVLGGVEAANADDLTPRWDESLRRYYRVVEVEPNP